MNLEFPHQAFEKPGQSSLASIIEHSLAAMHMPESTDPRYPSFVDYPEGFLMQWRNAHLQLLENYSQPDADQVLEKTREQLVRIRQERMDQAAAGDIKAFHVACLESIISVLETLKKLGANPLPTVSVPPPQNMQDRAYYFDNYAKALAQAVAE